MRIINQTLFAGDDVALTDVLYESNGRTLFDGTLYEVVGRAQNIADEATYVDFSGTIDDSGNISATLAAEDTANLGGLTMKFDVVIKSGPLQSTVFSGQLTFIDRVTP